MERMDLLNNIMDFSNQQNKDIVQETESENNCSDIYKSGKKIGRRKSYRKDELFKLKRRNSIRKSYSPTSKSSVQKNSNESFIKLHRIESENKHILRQNISPDYSFNKYSSRRKKNQRIFRNWSVFDDLYDKKLLSSLGRKLPKPEIPKSVYPQSRMSYVKLRRPCTAIVKRVKVSKNGHL